MTTETTAGTDGMRGRWSAALMDNYGTPGLALTHGSGAVVVDADGREYLDLLGGIAVNALGHGHPAMVAQVFEPGGVEEEFLPHLRTLAVL